MGDLHHLLAVRPDAPWQRNTLSRKRLGQSTGRSAPVAGGAFAAEKLRGNCPQAALFFPSEPPGLSRREGRQPKSARATWVHVGDRHILRPPVLGARRVLRPKNEVTVHGPLLSPFAPRKWHCFRGAKGDYPREMARKRAAARERLRMSQSLGHAPQQREPATCRPGAPAWGRAATNRETPAAGSAPAPGCSPAGTCPWPGRST